MIDLNEINRDPWPTFPVNKDDLRSLLAENARLREALLDISAIVNQQWGGDWDETENARAIARAALGKKT